MSRPLIANMIPFVSIGIVTPSEKIYVQYDISRSTLGSVIGEIFGGNNWLRAGLHYH